MHRFFPALTLGLVLAATGAKAEAPNVVVSIKPIHSLVTALMDGVAVPGLIVDGGASPHTFSMRPSGAAELEQADVVVWVGHGLEAFLEKPLEALGGKARIVELEDAPGLSLLTFREGGAFEGHDHGEEGHDDAHAEDKHGEEAGHDHAAEEAHKGDHKHAEEAGHEDHEHGGFDMHLWLDPSNARAIAATVEKTLAEVDPANAATYAANLAALNTKLDALDSEIAATVAPIKDRPFVVFHDAYQYFEKHYGVRVAGSITVSPETLPGAERISEIHKKVEDLGATCVFAEPQFEPKLVQVVLEGTPAKSGVLDPEGASLEPGADLYFNLMRGIATSLKTCLGQAS